MFVKVVVIFCCACIKKFPSTISFPKVIQICNCSVVITSYHLFFFIFEAIVDNDHLNCCFIKVFFVLKIISETFLEPQKYLFSFSCINLIDRIIRMRLFLTWFKVCVSKFIHASNISNNNYEIDGRTYSNVWPKLPNCAIYTRMNRNFFLMQWSWSQRCFICLYVVTFLCWLTDGFRNLNENTHRQQPNIINCVCVCVYSTW